MFNICILEFHFLKLRNYHPTFFSSGSFAGDVNREVWSQKRRRREERISKKREINLKAGVNNRKGKLIDGNLASQIKLSYAVIAWKIDANIPKMLDSYWLENKLNIIACLA